MNTLTDIPRSAIIDLAAVYRDSNVAEVLDKLDAELVGLKPIKTRIREIAALLVIAKARSSIGLQANAPSLHIRIAVHFLDPLEIDDGYDADKQIGIASGIRIAVGN